MNAHSITSVLLEDGEVPFDKEVAILQYRPYRMSGIWKWFWILLPRDQSKALATGTADTRAGAAIMARLKARNLGIVIDKIDVMVP